MFPWNVGKVKQSHHTPWRRLEEEDVLLQLVLDLGTRWGEPSASRLGRALPPEKRPPVQIEQEAGWISELVLTQRLEEIGLASDGDRTTIAQSSL
jgi:hypothetical protein